MKSVGDSTWRDSADEITQVTRSGAASSRETSAGEARLILLSGPQAGRKFPLSASVRIGRSPDLEICLEDKRLSRVHAGILRTQDGRFVLTDHESRNGTFVNGQRVREHQLAFGDRIVIGGSTLLFTHDNPLDAQIEQKQKLEMLGRLGAGIAHDFNNLLGVAIASLEFLQSQPRDRKLGEEAVKECLTDIRHAMERATELTGRLLGVARQKGYVLRRVDVAALVGEVMEFLRRVLPRNITLESYIEPGLHVTGDQSQLHQALMNLGINARDAMEQGGRLSLTVERRRGGGSPGEHQGDFVVLSVADTGAGMDEATKKRAFETFFTTKGKGKGTGLGLSTVLEIAKYHGGFVELDSTLGQGTTVRLLLPSAPERQPVSRMNETLMDAAPIVSATTIVPLPAGSPRVDATMAPRPARVLVVDDDEAVVRSLARLLKLDGHEVFSAADGQQAVNQYRSLQPDLVLMDLDMPVMSGQQAFSRIRLEDPYARVALMSGHWSESQAADVAALTGRLGFLQKPCDRAELSRMVTLAMEQARADLGAGRKKT